MKIENSSKSPKDYRPQQKLASASPHSVSDKTRVEVRQSTSDERLATSPPPLLAKLHWLSPAYRKLAERRATKLHENALPYVVAQRRLGNSSSFVDASVAYEHIFLKSESTKLLHDEGLSWDSDKAKTTFSCIFPDEAVLLPLGTFDELRNKGLSGGEIGRLLHVNEVYEARYDDDDDDEEPALDVEWGAVTRACFYLLSSAGHILPKSQSAADAILKPLNDEQKGFALANVMAMSAGSQEPTFLRIALKLGIEPNQRSRLVEATPLEHAERKGSEVALNLLRPHSLR